MKTLYLFISLLALSALAGCSHNTSFEMPYSKTAYEKGKLDAHSELEKGTLAIESFGLPPVWIRLYKKILKEKYGIEDRSVAGCVVDDEIIGHAKGFNEVMEAEIQKRHADDVFEKASIEAQDQYQRMERQK